MGQEKVTGRKARLLHYRRALGSRVCPGIARLNTAPRPQWMAELGVIGSLRSDITSARQIEQLLLGHVSLRRTSEERSIKSVDLM